MAAPFRISVTANVKQITKDLDDFVKRQVPFATAQALTATARAVADAEVQLIKEDFPSATPFTQKSVGARAARKSSPTAIVYMRDIAAAYLEPYLDGGLHKLNSQRAMLYPKAIGLNTYGNIPKGKVATLKGRGRTFVGSIKLKNGQTVGGVWQRLPPPKKAKRRKNAAPGAAKAASVAPAAGHLKLLVRFGDPVAVNQRLDWFQTADATVKKVFHREMAVALRKALASAR